MKLSIQFLILIATLLAIISIVTLMAHFDSKNDAEYIKSEGLKPYYNYTGSFRICYVELNQTEVMCWKVIDAIKNKEAQRIIKLLENI